MSDRKKDPKELLNEPLHGIYIPSFLIIFGIGIHSLSLVPYAILVVAIFWAVRIALVYRRNISLSKDKWNNFELIDKTIISKNSAIYRFKLYNETENIGIPVGQHVACKFQIDGKDEIRYYSPISSQFDQGFFDILVKSYADGVISKKFASLQNGEMVPFKGPVGRMSYSTNMAKQIGMIAGGSGITPILQVLSYVTTTPEDCTEISLIYANETENDILLREEIDELAEKYPYFKVTYTLTHPSDKWDGESGYITREMCEKYLPKASDSSKIFICGPPEMNSLASDICSELGFAKGSVPSKKEDQIFVF